MTANPKPRLDGTAAPGSSLPERRTAPQRLLALTRDAMLTHALQDLAGGVGVVLVEDLRELSDELLQQGSNLALIDAAALDAPVDSVVDAIATQFPDLRLLVAGGVGEQNLLASRIANETVFRFVHKPASAQRLQTFLEAAAREGERRRNPVDPALAGAAPRPPSARAFVIAAAVAIAIAVAAAWAFWPHGAAARLNATDLARVETLMQQANEAMAAGRYAGFDGSSAAELYRDVLQIDARNDAARPGLEAAINGALDGAAKALADGELDTGRADVEAVRLVAPDHARLAGLSAQVDAEARRELADARERQTIEERTAQIHAALDRMHAHIAAGELLDPDADNAVTAFQAAQQVSPGDADVRAARTDILTALMSTSERALEAAHVPEARRYAVAAVQINSSAVGLTALFNEIAAASAPAATAPQSVAKPAAEVAQAAPPEAAPTSATAVDTNQAIAALSSVSVSPVAAPVALVVPPTPAPAPVESKTNVAPPATDDGFVPGEGVVVANKLQALRRVAVEYPTEALEQMVSGWVELEFTVAKDGAVKDIVVTAAEPRRMFESAAIGALRKYRYAPVLKDGQPVEQRAKTRMRFTVKDRNG